MNKLNLLLLSIFDEDKIVNMRVKHSTFTKMSVLLAQHSTFEMWKSLHHSSLNLSMSWQLWNSNCACRMSNVVLAWHSKSRKVECGMFYIVTARHSFLWMSNVVCWADVTQPSKIDTFMAGKEIQARIGTFIRAWMEVTRWPFVLL